MSIATNGKRLRASRRGFLISGLAAAAGIAHAQASGEAIKWIVPYPAGGVTDQIARLIAQRMSHELGQTIVIENRPGAGTRIGTDAVARAPADGHTLLFTNSNYSFLPITNPHAPVDPIKTLTPVSALTVYGLQIVINNDIPAKTLPEFIAYAKRNPGKLNYGSAGSGSAFHFFGEYLKSLTGTYIVHIPYKSTNEALLAVVRGELAIAFDGAAKPLIDTGRVRLLAVTGGVRDPRFPNTPTAVEAGLKDFVISSWAGLLAPVATPQPVIDRLNRASVTALADPLLQKKLEELGMTPQSGGPGLLANMIHGELALYRGIAAKANLKIE